MAPYQYSLFLVLAWTVYLSYATHFRGVTTSFTPKDNSGTVQFCHRIAWRLRSSEAKCAAEGEEAGENRNFVCTEIDGSNGCPSNPLTMKYTCETIFDPDGTKNDGNNGDGDWALGGKCSDVTFDLTETTRFYISDGVPCCWITLEEVGAGRDIEARMMMDLRIRSDNSEINNSPRATLRGLRRIQAGCEVKMKIDFQDEDNDKVVCRFATGVAECGGICGALESAGATIDEERCILEWLSPAEGMHAAAVMIEDFDAEDNLLSSVPLQFLIEVFPLEGPCLTPTVQPRDVCFIIQPGATFTQDIVATPVDDSNAAEVSTITDIVITSKPTLMTVGDLVEDSVTNEAKKTATWTPTVAEYGSHQFCYTAIDDNGRESPACVTLKAGVSEELPVIEDFSPKDDALLLNDPQELTITFTERVAIPSLDTKSIRVHEFDGDEEIEVIDVTESSSQVTLLDGEKSATIKITKTLFPDRRHYVLVDDGAFTALEDCAGLQSPVSGISDKNTWTFIAEGGPGKCGFTDDCHEKAVCTDIFGDPLVDFRCECMPGYTGDGKTCEDTDECDLVNPTHDCDAMADCDNTPSGSFTCTCKEGYAGDGKTCEDIDECDLANPTHDCHAMATCTNTPSGSFTCTCKEGYAGDGKTSCEDIDECDLTNPTHDCHAMATCTNTPSGSFTCTCKEGYAGDGKTSCEDINECDPANPTHNCLDMADCDNTPSGSFTCTCKEGYAGDGTTICEDIDECKEGLHDCPADRVCINTEGSFQCGCDVGLFFDGVSCVDNCTAGWPVVRDRYIANDTDWQDLSENCPGANFDDPSVMDDEPPIKQWQMLLEQFLKDYAGWLDIIRNLISDVPRLPDIDPNASPEEVWDILYEVHKQAQEAWQEQVGDPNGITFPDPFADCEDDRRSKWLMSAATTEESVDKYREVFGDRCDA